jgi:hypothetical protein
MYVFIQLFGRFGYGAVGGESGNQAATSSSENGPWVLISHHVRLKAFYVAFSSTIPPLARHNSPLKSRNVSLIHYFLARFG